MPTGVVKWFDHGKGYGFLVQDSADEPDLFVHARNTQYGSLEAGDRVAFKVGRDGSRRLIAKDVKLDEEK